MFFALLQSSYFANKQFLEYLKNDFLFATSGLGLLI